MTETSEVKPVEAEIPSALACPEGDIFSLPTKDEIVNAFNQMAAIPGQMQGKVLEMKAERKKEIADLYEKLKDPDLTEEETAAILEEIDDKENFIKTQIEGVIQEQVNEVSETVEDFVDTLATILSPYWNKEGPNRDWQKEARDAFEELLQEFHTYIPTKIAEIISSIIPFNFSVPILGIQIDILKLITSPAYKQELIDQISGKSFDLEIAEKFKEIKKISEEIDKLVEELADPDISMEDHIKKTEELEALAEKKKALMGDIDDISELKDKFIDKFWQLVPEEFRQFDGEYGVVDNKAKAKIIYNYIKTQIKKYVQNTMMAIFQELIGIFDKIWKLLGLPDTPIQLLTDIMSMDIAKIVNSAIQTLKDEWEELKESLQTDIGKLNDKMDKLKEELADPDISDEDYFKKLEELEELRLEKKDLENKLLEEGGKFRSLIREKVLGLSIFGFSIKDILGADIKSTTASIEEEISEILLALEDFKMNWHKKIMFDWVKIVKKFLSAIGLGAIFEIMFLTWCDFLKLIGMPMSIDLKIPAIAGVITAVVKETKKDTKPVLDDTVVLDGIQYPTSDEGISFATGDGEETGFSVSSGTGTVYAFVTAGKIPAGQENAGDPLVTEYEHGSGVTILGNTVTFDTPPIEGASVSIIKI